MELYFHHCGGNSMDNSKKILEEVKQFTESILNSKEDIINIYKKNHNNHIKYWITAQVYNTPKSRNIFKNIFRKKESVSYLVEIINKSKDINKNNFKENVHVEILNKSNGDMIKFILNTKGISDLELKSFYTTLSNTITGLYEGDYDNIPLILSTANYNLENSIKRILKFVDIDPEAVKQV